MLRVVDLGKNGTVAWANGNGRLQRRGTAAKVQVMIGRDRLIFAVSFRLGYILSALGRYDDRFHTPLAGPMEELISGPSFYGWVADFLSVRFGLVMLIHEGERLGVSSWNSAVSEESNILKRHAHLKEYNIYAKWRPKL
jgi:hypothetical protein